MVSHYLQYILLRFVLMFLQAMSIERCDRLAHVLARVLARWIPLRRKLVDENLKLVYPEWSSRQVDSTREAMWHHLLLMVCEIAHAPRKIHRTNWRKHYYIPDRARVVRHGIDSRPQIFVTGHFGNFELYGFIAGVFGYDSSTIARPLDNRFVHDYFMEFRSLGGQHFIDKNGSTGEIQKLLESGGRLAMLADQDAGNKGCWSKFLGQPASCHKALALFTLSSGAPMMVMANARLSPMRFHTMVLGVADPSQDSVGRSNVSELTQWYNDCLEKAIQRYPEQYWWVHRRWREPPPRLRKLLERAAA